MAKRTLNRLTARTVEALKAPGWRSDGGGRIDAIGTEDVLEVLQPIWSKLPETAQRLRGRIENVVDAAKAKGHRAGENPARWRGHLDSLLPERQKLTRGHHAAMDYADMPDFMAAIRGRDAIAARLLEFTILTAARTGEAIGARCVEFDLERGDWNIPAKRMKAGKPHRVPLLPCALMTGWEVWCEPKHANVVELRPWSRL